MTRMVKACLFFILFSFMLPVIEASVPDAFRQVMVTEGGRVMPLDSYARNLLSTFSGRQSLAGRSAVDWMAEMLFRPENTVNDAIFLIDNPDIYSALGLSGDKRGRLSYRQLEPVISRLSELARAASWLEPAKRSVVENGLLQLYEHVYRFVTLRDSFVWALPHSDFAVRIAENKRRLAVPDSVTALSYVDLYSQRNLFDDEATDPETLSSELDPELRSEWKRLGAAFRKWQSEIGKGSLLLLPREQSQEAWLPLSAALDENHPGHPGLLSWLKAMSAYRDGRNGAFETQIREFNAFIARQPATLGLGRIIAREVVYNRLDPFFWARVAYGISLVLLLLSFLFWSRLMRRFSLLVLGAGWLLHTTGLVLRYLITHRSPVTNLFETFIFVAWASVLLGLFLGLRRHLALCLTASGASGLAFLMVAARFATGDTMGQLVAVLNSNWWLSVHVITITAGYAGCVVAGVIGHVYIGQSLLKKSQADSLAHTLQMLYATLVFGLFFTFVGTVMGGIWADQSWGRFWGWDPKENGALIIILWVAVILHARLTKMIGSFGVAAGAVGAIIMVVLAWFGVNLLGVGMHSYGFTSGIAKGLALFVIGEILFLVVTGYKTRGKRLKA